jgi:hypothetical protein
MARRDVDQIGRDEIFAAKKSPRPCDAGILIDVRRADIYFNTMSVNG